jgi:hypothetical protein
LKEIRSHRQNLADIPGFDPKHGGLKKEYRALDEEMNKFDRIEKKS